METYPCTYINTLEQHYPPSAIIVKYNDLKINLSQITSSKCMQFYKTLDASHCVQTFYTFCTIFALWSPTTRC